MTEAPTRRRPVSAGLDLDELAALEEQRSFLLRSLDDSTLTMSPSWF